MSPVLTTDLPDGTDPKFFPSFLSVPSGKSVVKTIPIHWERGRSLFCDLGILRFTDRETGNTLRAMASQFDDTDFIDREFQESQQTAVVGEELSEPSLGVSSETAMTTGSAPLPTREELEAKVGDTQIRLSKLKRQQELLEQQRVALEETRRRRKEFQDGKTEMLQHLTRGIALLEESELALRRDSTQMTKALASFQESFEKIGSFSEEAWTAENVEVELTRALTAIENARMEWNSARLKWSFLDGAGSLPNVDGKAEAKVGGVASLAELPFAQLCRIGIAFTWPLVAMGAIGVVVLLFR